MRAVILMSVCVIVAASAGVLRQQLNKFYRSRRCVSKIALELTEELKIRRPVAAQLAEPSRVAR
jgi:hypothetical protein